MFDDNMCRIMPHFVAANYEYFELLSKPLNKTKDIKRYVLRVKQKITCMKEEFLL